MKGEKYHMYLSTKERNEIGAVYQGAPQMFLYALAHKMQTEQLPCRHRPTGGGDVSPAGKIPRRKGKCNRRTQGKRYDALGAEDE